MVNMQTNRSPLETEPLTKLLFRYSVPTTLTLMVNYIYNIVDQIFVGQGVGITGMAAINIAFPLSILVNAVSLLLGDGCAANVSLCLGRREQENANKIFGQAVTWIVASGIALAFICGIFAPHIVTLFGTTNTAYGESLAYMRVIAIGIPFQLICPAFTAMIRADGSPQYTMKCMMAGAVVNIILDPIFIFVFHWGMMGAAVATVAGQVLTAVLAIWYLFHLKAVKLSSRSFHLDGRVIRKFIPLGICSFLSQISLVAAMAAVNNMIRKYGALDPVFGQAQYAQIPMAVVGIVMKFFQIVISVVVGMAAGCIPIVGYNIGAGRKDRAKQLFHYLLTAEACVGLAALLIAELLPGQLIWIFGAANESVYYTEFAVKAFRVYLCMMILACVNKATFIYLQSLGEAMLSTVLSMVREVVFGVGFALLLPVFFGLDGVLYSMPVSDVLTFIISLWAIMHTCRKLSE